MYVVVMTYIWISRSRVFLYNRDIVVLHVFTSLLGGVPLYNSLGIVQWNSTRRDHPGNPGKGIRVGSCQFIPEYIIKIIIKF